MSRIATVAVLAAVAPSAGFVFAVPYNRWRFQSPRAGWSHEGHRVTASRAVSQRFRGTALVPRSAGLVRVHRHCVGTAARGNDTARAATGRGKIVKFEGHFHG